MDINFTPKIINYTNSSKLYLMTLDGVNEFENKLANGSYGDIFDFMTKNPMEAISSLRIYPINLRGLLANTGGFQPTNEITLLATPVRLDGNVVYNYIGNYQQVLDSLKIPMVKDYHITRKYNNFLDYAPYTTLRLYLPYIDMISLNVSEVMDKYISVTYVLDLMTGNVTGVVEVRDSLGAPKRVIAQVSGMLGMDIPLGQVNVQEMTLKNLTNTINLASSGLSLLIGASSGNGVASAIGGIGLLKSTTIGAIEANQEHHTKAKASGDFTSFYTPQEVYLVRETINSEPIDYATTKGRPMGKQVKLGNLNGYTKVGKVHLEGFGYATSQELEEIENYLLDGVIL